MLQDIHEARSLEISKFNSELMMVLTTQDCLVSILSSSLGAQFGDYNPFFFLLFLQLFSSGDFTKLLAISCPDGSRWAGGTFIDQNLLLLWSTNEKGFVYRLPKFSTAINFSMQSIARKAAAPQSDPLKADLLLTLAKSQDLPIRPSHTSVMGYFPPKKDNPSSPHSLVCFGTRGVATVLTQWTFDQTHLSQPTTPIHLPTTGNGLLLRY